MSEPTKTMAFRLSPAEKEQIQELATGANQNQSDWVRDQIRRALYAASPLGVSDSPEPRDRETALLERLDVLDARLERMEAAFREQIIMVLKAVAETSKIQRKELRMLGQLVLDSDDLTGEQFDAFREDVLAIVDRIKASQRSHKDSILRAIPGGHERGKYARY